MPSDQPIRLSAELLDATKGRIVEGEVQLQTLSVTLIFWPTDPKIADNRIKSARFLRIEGTAKYEIEQMIRRDGTEPLHYELRVVV